MLGGRCGYWTLTRSLSFTSSYFSCECCGAAGEGCASGSGRLDGGVFGGVGGHGGQLWVPRPEFRFICVDG